MRAPDWSGPSGKAMNTGIKLGHIFQRKIPACKSCFVAQKQMTYSKGGQRCLEYSEGRYVLEALRVDMARFGLTFEFGGFTLLVI